MKKEMQPSFSIGPKDPQNPDILELSLKRKKGFETLSPAPRKAPRHRRAKTPFENVVNYQKTGERKEDRWGVWSGETPDGGVVFIDHGSSDQVSAIGEVDDLFDPMIRWTAPKGISMPTLTEKEHGLLWVLKKGDDEKKRKLRQSS